METETDEQQKETLPPPEYSDEEEWVQEYKKQFGEAPTFF